MYLFLNRFSPGLVRFRKEFKEGRYAISAETEARRAAFRIGGAVPTRDQKREILEDIRADGLEDRMEIPTIKARDS